MSIQGTLDELKDMLQPYLDSMVRDFIDRDGFAVSRKGPAVVTNDLRPPEADEEDEKYLESIYPFVLLRAPSGSTSTDGVDTAENAVNVIAVIGIHAPEEDMQGERDVADVIDRIIDAVRKNPYTKHCRISPDVSWQVDESETHPYYFGAVTLTAYDRLTTGDESNI